MKIKTIGGVSVGYMVDDVRCITNVWYDGNEWMKVRVGRGEAQPCS